MTLIAFQTRGLRERADGSFEFDDSDLRLDEVADARELYAAKEHFQHRLVTLSEPHFDRAETFIAAFPSSGSGPLLELDESGRPLRGSERAIRAIGITEGILGGQVAPLAAEVRSCVEEIHALLDARDARLTELLFERLHDWAVAQRLDNELPQLFWLLPWGDFATHLQRLELLLARDKQSHPEPDPTLEEELPELTHLFRYLSAGLAPALREVTEWRSTDAPLSARLLSAVSRRLHRVAVEQIPPDARSAIGDAAEAIGRWAGIMLRRPSVPREHVLTAQVMTDAYEFLLQLEAPIENSWDRGRVKWLGRIAIAAQAAGYPSDRLRLRQATADRFMAEVGDPPIDIAEDMTPIEVEGDADRFFDRCFILHFAAVHALKVLRRPDLSLFCAHQARRGLQRFALNPLPFRRTPLCNLLPRTCLLEFDCAWAARDRNHAEVALRTFGEVIQPCAERLNEKTVDLLRAEALLRAQALFEDDERDLGAFQSAVSLEIEGESFVAAARELCLQVLEENFTNRKAWRLYLENVEPSIGIEKIEAALGDRRDDVDLDQLGRSTLQWLEYKLASLARQRAEDIPEALLEAFDSYLKLVTKRPRDLAVMQELLEIFSELDRRQTQRSREMLEAQLMSLDDPDIPLIHGVLRWVLLEQVPDAEEVQGANTAFAIVGSGEGGESRLRRAEEVMITELRRSRFVAMVFELITKWIYEEARALGDKPRLRTVARLLEPAVAARPRDAIWWTRRADIAIAERDSVASKELMEEIPSFLRDDSLAHFQRARLLLTSGKLEAAEEELVEAARLNREATGSELPRAEILDKLGFIALRQQRYDDAEDLYLAILAENGVDPRAHYGLGRVYLENPDYGASEVLNQWRRVLRVHSSGSETAKHFAWRAAAAIAGLVHKQLTAAPAASATDLMLEGLRDLVRVEDTSSSMLVVNALRVRGVIDPRTAEVVRGAEPHALGRSVAHYLMARAIHVYIESPEIWKRFIEEELLLDLARCRDQKVLGDFFAGAKGSYARALVRTRTGSGELPQAPRDSGEAVESPDLDNLVEHVVHTTRSAEYYSDAYRHLLKAGRVSDRKLLAAACQIIARLAVEIGGKEQGEGDLMVSLQPSIGLETIGHTLGSDTPGVTGYVDADALLYAKVTKNLDEWELRGTAMASTTPVHVSLDARRSYKRAGLDWESANGSGHYCYVNLIHPLSQDSEEGGESQEEVLAVA